MHQRFIFSFYVCVCCACAACVPFHRALLLSADPCPARSSKRSQHASHVLIDRRSIKNTCKYMSTRYAREQTRARGGQLMLINTSCKHLSSMVSSEMERLEHGNAATRHFANTTTFELTHHAAHLADLILSKDCANSVAGACSVAGSRALPGGELAALQGDLAPAQRPPASAAGRPAPGERGRPAGGPTALGAALAPARLSPPSRDGATACSGLAPLPVAPASALLSSAHLGHAHQVCPRTPFQFRNVMSGHPSGATAIPFRISFVNWYASQPTQPNLQALQLYPPPHTNSDTCLHA